MIGWRAEREVCLLELRPSGQSVPVPVPAAFFEPGDDQSLIVVYYNPEFPTHVSCGFLEELTDYQARPVTWKKQFFGRKKRGGDRITTLIKAVRLTRP